MTASLRADKAFNPNGILVACCAAGAAKAIEPPAWIFHPPGPELFNAGWTDIRFLTSVTAILSVLFLLSGGILGDIYGRRRLLLIGLVMTVAANACLVLAQSNVWHAIFRLLAAGAGAFVLPLALAPLYSSFQGDQQGRAFSWYVLVTTVALLLASRQGRILMAAFNWRAAYLAPMLIGAIALVLVLKYVPEQRVPGKRFADAIGHAGWTLIVLAVVYGLLQASVASAWLSLILAVTLLALLIGAIVVFWWNTRTPGALRRKRTIRTRDVTALIVTGVVIQLLLIGFYHPTYDFFEIAQGRSDMATLLALAPILLGMLAAMLLMARLMHRRRVSEVVGAGLVAVSAAIALMAVLPLAAPYALRIPALFLFGLGIMAAKTVWTNGFLQTLVNEYTGANSAMQSATLLIGGAVGAVLGTQLLVRFGQAEMDATLSGVLLPEQIAQLTRQLTSIVLQRVPLAVDPFGAVLLDAYRAAFASGYSMTCWVLAGIALIAALVMFTGVRRSLRFRGRTATTARRGG